MTPFNGAEKLRQRMAAFDATPKPEPVEEIKEVVVEPHDDLASQPSGPLFAIYKRTIPAMSNKPVMMSLTKDEAAKWQMILVKKEQKRRAAAADRAIERGLEPRPESVVVFDVVEQGTAQESMYWNPAAIVAEHSNEN